jgi:hypothetical protein
MKFFTALLSALALAASTTTTAIPVAERSELIVVTPEITSPKAGDDWLVGTEQTVTWNTRRIPKEAQDYSAEILLGFNDGTTDSENLSGELLPTPLHRSGSSDLKTPLFCMYVQLYVQTRHLQKAFC